jgi:4-hydroxy-tetrahydrodipicolinate reductase
MKIGIAGCKGRMGSLLVQEIVSGRYRDAALSGGTVLPAEMSKADFFITTDPDELFQKSDAVIDFTVPEATRKHVWLAAKHKKTLVIGTTGLTEADQKEIGDAAKETRIVQASNFSAGVNLLLALVEKTAATLDPDWDIEIFESHHKHKIDAPSGTALSLGKAAQAGRKGGAFVTDREGKRKSGDIGFSVARGGDVVGEHTVYFYAEGERIELAHVATNRALFARGAIRAALWALDQKKPGLYSMQDVLGL